MSRVKSTGANTRHSGGWLQKFRDMPNDSPAKTLIVALAVSLFGSILVSTSAVLLKPLQLANKERERQQDLLEIVERLPGIGALFETVEAHHVEAQVVDLATGNYVRSFNPDAYDQRRAAQDPRQSIEIPPERDLAKIKRHFEPRCRSAQNHSSAPPKAFQIGAPALLSRMIQNDVDPRFADLFYVF